MPRSRGRPPAVPLAPGTAHGRGVGPAGLTVSILLPSYNAAPTLAACLRSVQRQTLADWECVLVDDGSTDSTAAVLHEAARGDPRFVVIGRPHCGVVAALNAGLAACRGRFVARMDADDLMHRDRLAQQVAALTADAGLAATACRVRVFPRAGLRAGRRAYEAWLNAMERPEEVAANAYVECPVAHPTLMVRGDVLRRSGYRACGWPEDYDLVLRLLEAGHAIGVVPRRLLSWRDHPARLSRTAPEYDLSRFTACKAAFLARGFLAATEEYALWGYGGTGRALTRALRAHGKRPAYIVEVHAGRLGQAIHGAPVVPPAALPDLPWRPLVVSVAGVMPRTQIRAALVGMGRVELRDFVCAA